MSKLNGLGKTHRECIFVVELNLKLCSFTTNKLFEKIQVLNEWKFHRLFSKIPSVSVVQFTVQMFKLNGLGKTHRERIFVVELKLKLRSLFHYEQIVWENSDIKWIKVPSPKQIHSETNIFLSTKVIWEREKRGLISYLSTWGSDQRLFAWKYCPAGKTRYICEKWQRK